MVDDRGIGKVAHRPALPQHVAGDQPFGHQELGGEGVRLDLLLAVSAAVVANGSAQQIVVVQARLVTEREVTELMGGGEALDAHRAERRNEHAGGGGAQIGAEKPIEGTQEEGQAD